MLLTLLIVSSFKLLNDTKTLRERIGSGNSWWNSELICQHLQISHGFLFVWRFKSGFLRLYLSTSRRHSVAQSSAVLRNRQLCLSDSRSSLPLCHWLRAKGWMSEQVWRVCVVLWFRVSQRTSLDPCVEYIGLGSLWFCIQMTTKSQSWKTTFRRTLSHFGFLDFSFQRLPVTVSSPWKPLIHESVVCTLPHTWQSDLGERLANHRPCTCLPMQHN